MIQEIQRECPALEHIIVTGQWTFVFVEPEGTGNVQIIFEKSRFVDSDTAFQTIGTALIDAFKELGLEDAWCSHQGAIRASGKKLATILLSEIENLYVLNAVTYLQQMDTVPLFKGLYVPPEIKERALEPMTSVKLETGKDVALDEFKNILVKHNQKALDVDFEEGKLTRDELIAYVKNRALAARI